MKITLRQLAATGAPKSIRDFVRLPTHEGLWLLYRLRETQVQVAGGGSKVGHLPEVDHARPPRPYVVVCLAESRGSSGLPETPGGLHGALLSNPQWERLSAPVDGCVWREVGGDFAGRALLREAL